MKSWQSFISSRTTIEVLSKFLFINCHYLSLGKVIFIRRETIEVAAKLGKMAMNIGITKYIIFKPKGTVVTLTDDEGRRMITRYGISN